MSHKRLDFEIDWGLDEVKELGKAVLPEPGIQSLSKV
jgi:hypothetical protein